MGVRGWNGGNENESGMAGMGVRVDKWNEGGLSVIGERRWLGNTIT